MIKNLLLHAIVMLVGTFISSIAQVLLKKAAMEEHESAIQEYMNSKVFVAYMIFFLATFLSIIAYRYVPLSMGAILEATGYIYVTVFGVMVFHERIGIAKAIALAMIVSGIMMYAAQA